MTSSFPRPSWLYPGGHVFEVDRLYRTAQLDQERCNTRWCNHEAFMVVLSRGARAFERYIYDNPAYRGAWRKGLEAWRAGVLFHDNPYRARGRSDRRGRYNAGFSATFAMMWDAGWSWGEWTESDEAAMLVLAATAPRDRDLDSRFWAWRSAIHTAAPKR